MRQPRQGKAVRDSRVEAVGSGGKRAIAADLAPDSSEWTSGASLQSTSERFGASCWGTVGVSVKVDEWTRSDWWADEGCSSSTWPVSGGGLAELRFRDGMVA